MFDWIRLRLGLPARHRHDFNTFRGAYEDRLVGFAAFLWECECGATMAETLDLPDDEN